MQVAYTGEMAREKLVFPAGVFFPCPHLGGGRERTLPGGALKTHPPHSTMLLFGRYDLGELSSRFKGQAQDSCWRVARGRGSFFCDYICKAAWNHGGERVTTDAGGGGAEILSVIL